MSDSKLTVGIADMKMAQGNGVLITYALGSCIGLCFHDPRLRLGALLHIMLPLNMEAGRKNPLKYADTGIRETLKQMEAKGASRSRMTVKIAGGAKMFEISGNADFGNIGQRNEAAVKQTLMREGLRVSAEDTGGSYARTMILNIQTGAVSVRTFGRAEKFL